MLCQLPVEEELKNMLILEYLTMRVFRDPRGVTDVTLPATNCCKSCRLLVVAELKNALIFKL